MGVDLAPFLQMGVDLRKWGQIGKFPIKKMSSSPETNGMVEISLETDEFIPVRTEPSPSRSRGKHTAQPTSGSIPAVDMDERIIPWVVEFLQDRADIVKCLTLSWAWFKAAVVTLYGDSSFSQMSGRRLGMLLQTLQLSVVQGASIIPYHQLVRSVSISHVVFEESTPLQSWFHVRDLLALCASTIEALHLTIGDDGFMDLPNDYVYLHPQISFPRLKSLQMETRCSRLPERLILELLRASPIESLAEIKLPRCLQNLGASGWFLIAERGGSALTQLVLTPPIGANLLGWDEQLFHLGVEQLARSCPRLTRLDLSGHTIPAFSSIVSLLMASLPDLTHISFPCAMSDAHLLPLLTSNQWPSLKSLSLSCHCVDGQERVKKPNGKPCNEFSDSVIGAVLEHLAIAVSTSLTVELSTHLISVKTGKSVLTIDYISSLPNASLINENTIVLHSKVTVVAQSARLIT